MTRNLISYLSLAAIFVAKAQAGALLNMLYSSVPNACKANCTTYLNSTMPCIENLGTLGVVYNPVDGSSTINADTLGIYLCGCSTSAIANSASCLSCISTSMCLSPAITSTTYNNICLGQQGLSSLYATTSRTC